MVDTPNPKNPIFTRWNDPFVFMSRDFLIGYGDGNLQKGYDRVLDNFIARWNKNANAPGSKMPRTSREHGLEWIPTFDENGNVKRLLDDGTIIDPPPREDNNGE